MMSKVKKIGVNDPCPCNSGNKYKKCCQKAHQLMKEGDVIIGHTVSSEIVQTVVDTLSAEYADHRVVDISNTLNASNYRIVQTKNYHEKTIMVCEKNDANRDIFLTRANDIDMDVIVLYRGAYQCFDHDNLQYALDNVKNMIDTRLSGNNM